MIRIHRSAEPAELAVIRKARVDAARSATTLGEPIAFREYDAVKPELAKMQHLKCCYCEKREEQAKYRDVEHYRPKVPYWWLAWTWGNLLFACQDCNRDRKRGQFPLRDPLAVLKPETVPPGSESPLVIDPSDAGVDPVDAIQFRREIIQGLERWVPRPRNGDPRGKATIEVCGLDRAGLLDLYVDHVNSRIRPKLEPFQDARKRGDAKTAYAAWSRAIRGLLAPGAAFRGLSFDALDALVPETTRLGLRLELPRPT